MSTSLIREGVCRRCNAPKRLVLFNPSQPAAYPAGFFHPRYTWYVFNQVNSMCQTTVVNVSKNEFDVYIGRPHPRFPKGSEFGNPFKVGADGTREEVVEKFFRYAQTNPVLLAKIKALKGQRLGCWCKPKLCHGDVIAALAEGREDYRDRPPTQESLF